MLEILFSLLVEGFQGCGRIFVSHQGLIACQRIFESFDQQVDVNIDPLPLQVSRQVEAKRVAQLFPSALEAGVRDSGFAVSCLALVAEGS